MIFSTFPPTELWRLVIDGYQHSLGPYAFDNPRGKPGEAGYHAGEAGYLKAMLEGLRYVKKYPQDRVSLPLIATLHKIATMGVEDGEITRNHADFKKEDRLLIAMQERGKMGHNATSSFKLNRPQAEQPGTDNVSLQGFIELVAWLKENSEYQKYFQLVAENGTILDPSSPDILEFYQTNHIVWNCGRIQGNILAEIISNKLTEFNRKIDEADKNEKLTLIVKLIHELEIIHPFQDGNCRTFFLLLNHLLVQNELSPTLLTNPNRFDGFSIDELINEVKNGQVEYKKYLINDCIIFIQSINPYRFNITDFKNGLSHRLAKEPHICAAQLNFIYQSINDKKIYIPEKEAHLLLCTFPVPGRDLVKREVLTTIKDLFSEINLENISSKAIKTHIEGYAIYKDMYPKNITAEPESSSRLSLN